MEGPDDLDRAYARALAEGDPEAGRLRALLDFRRALYRRDLEEAERLLPPGEKELRHFLADLEEDRYLSWLKKGPPFARAEAWVRRGVELALSGEREAARGAFEEALRWDPRHPRALVNLGNLELEAGRVDAAIDYYQRALKLDPDLADAHHNLAVAYRRKGEIDRMVRHLKRAERLRLYPPRESRGRRGGVPPFFTRFWFWLLLAVLLYLLLGGRG